MHQLEKKLKEFINLSPLGRTDNCGKVDDKYLNNTSNDDFTNTFILYNTDRDFIKFYQDIIISSKSKIRKPTEIILLTDGFSYSASSFLIKGM